MSISSRMKAWKERRAKSKAEGRPLLMREKKWKALKEFNEARGITDYTIPRTRTLTRIKRETALVNDTRQRERNTVKEREEEIKEETIRAREIMDKSEGYLTAPEIAEKMAETEEFIEKIWKTDIESLKYDNALIEEIGEVKPISREEALKHFEQLRKRLRQVEPNEERRRKLVENARKKV